MARKRWSDFKAGDKISAMALVVSVVAIGLGIWDAHLEREHQRLSVVPKVIARFVDGSDNEITGIVLENAGLGPARILNARLFVRGEFISEAYDDTQWRKVLLALGGHDPDVRFVSFASDAFISAGKFVPFLYQRNSAITKESRAFLSSARSDLAISTCFCSLYIECWSYASPGLKDEPCESPLARYLLLGKGPLAESLKGIRRTIEPWPVH